MISIFTQPDRIVGTAAMNNESGMILPLALVVLMMLTVLLNGLVNTAQQELVTTHQEHVALQVRYQLRQALEEYWKELAAHGDLVDGSRRTRDGVCLGTRRSAPQTCSNAPPLRCQPLEASARLCDHQSMPVVLRHGGWWVRDGDRCRLVGQYWRWD